MIKRPKTGDYGVFSQKYIELTQEYGNIIQLLKKLRKQMNRFLEKDIDLDYSYASGKWSIRQSLVHIIDTELIFNYRALSIARGETQILLGFDQDNYAANNFEKYDLPTIKKYFNTTRRNTIALFNQMASSELNMQGIVSDYPLKVRAIPYILAGHQMHHHHIFHDKYLIN